MEGYRVEFAEEPTVDAECTVCDLPMRAPVQVTSCGHHFCEGCLENRRNRDGVNLRCQKCRKEIKEAPCRDYQKEKEIMDLKVKCNNQIKACLWTGPLKHLQKHIEDQHSVIDNCGEEPPNELHMDKWKNKHDMLLRQRISTMERGMQCTNYIYGMFALFSILCFAYLSMDYNRLNHQMVTQNTTVSSKDITTFKNMLGGFNDCSIMVSTRNLNESLKHLKAHKVKNNTKCYALNGYRVGINFKIEILKNMEVSFTEYIQILRGPFDHVLEWPFKATVRVSINGKDDCMDRTVANRAFITPHDDFKKPKYNSDNKKVHLGFINFHNLGLNCIVNDAIYLKVSITK